MKRIWTNGCFDVLHLGHIELFRYARSLGKTLTVGIDSDRRIRESKGENRPINNEKSRKKMLLSIRWVDNVVVFDSDQELQSLVFAHADAMVVGSDYKDKRVIGSEWCDVIFFDKLENYSTTEIIKKCQSNS